MVIAVVRLELRLAGVRSLKEKRGIVKPLLARLQNTFNVAAAETGHHDAWQSAEIGVAIVSADTRYANEIASAVMRLADDPGQPWEAIDIALELIHL